MCLTLGFLVNFHYFLREVMLPHFTHEENEVGTEINNFAQVAMLSPSASKGSACKLYTIQPLLLINREN